ncbi:MAG: hypothetical protein ACUVQV_03120 [Dissulfurimicrobium sp.]
MFIAFLELARQGKIRLVQETRHGDIIVLNKGDISLRPSRLYPIARY